MNTLARFAAAIAFAAFLSPAFAAISIADTPGAHPAGNAIVLAGEWRFALDRADAGVNEKWFAKNLPGKIQLPGALEAQGCGDEISTNTPWVLSLYDRNWFLRADYTNHARPGAVKVPFLCQPPRHYLGAAWYQRDIEIPADWSGRRVVLFLERPHWKSTVWLDAKEIGSDISLCAPHEFELGVTLSNSESPNRSSPGLRPPSPLLPKERRGQGENSPKQSSRFEPQNRSAPVPGRCDVTAPKVVVHPDAAAGADIAAPEDGRTPPAVHGEERFASEKPAESAREIMNLTPGKHTLTVRVDNRMILPYRPDAHSVSDSLAGAWNGIAGKMELRATTPVWVDDIQVFPKPDLKSALVRVQIGNRSGKQTTAQLGLTDSFLESLAIKGHWTQTNFQINVGPTGSSFEAEVTLPAKIETWDEFHPQLQAFIAVLKTAFSTNIQNILIGFRDFRSDGNQFILNGRPIYLRGTHFGGDFPLTGCPPTDVESWKKIFQTCKNYGLNHMRFHSWCPPEAAFEAADQLGFYLQVECGMWNEFSPGGAMEKILCAETERILRAYGNHPSFMLLSASNEAGGRWKEVLPDWVRHFRAEDARHLYTPDTGWSLIESPAEPVNGGADYLAIGHVGRSHDFMVRGNSAWFGRDFGASLNGLNVPVVSHELGQWCAYPDFDVIKKFTGFMRPGNYEIFRDSAAANGVLEFNHEFARASGKFQFACYKEEIEANLRTPGLGGFQLLDLHDYTGQGTALVGLLDPFWESKGYVTPDEFKKFCNTVVPLARLKQRVFTTADKLEVPVEVANFGAAALTNAASRWEIRDAGGKVVAGGEFATATIPPGKNFALGTMAADLSKLTVPGEYRLAVRVGQASRLPIGEAATARAEALAGRRDARPTFSNDWNFWVYPSSFEDSKPGDVLVTSSWDDAAAKLAAGGKVLFIPRAADLDWTCPPLDNVPVFWNRLMNPQWGRMLGLWCDTNHPALAEFPTGENCDWQWTQIIRGVRAVNLAKLPLGLRPVVAAIDDWNRNWKLGVLFEARVGKGKLLVSAIDVQRNENPVAQQLRRSLLDYADGDKFQPATEISPAQFAGLRFDTRVMRKLGATVQADGTDAGAAIDGDPNTFWLAGATGRGRNAPPPAKRPHALTVSFTNAVAMDGVVLMNRQNDRDHVGDVREFEIQTSDDGANWTNVAAGELVSTWNPQTIRFGKTVTARQIKFTSLSGFGGDAASALAELAVIYAGPKLPDNGDETVRYKHVKSTSSDVDEGNPATGK